jgi:NAD(P)-dependent dehydrogenase (short-subunit alcohol dehydrogenase family)
MPGRLQDKLCIITGATSGIGERGVAMFVAEGATVVFSGRRVLEGKAIEGRFAAGQALFVQADVTKEADVKSLVDTTVSKFGRIDCFWANAGGPGPTGGIGGIDSEDYRACIAVNLDSVMFGMKHAGPVMASAGKGSIINTASIAGLRAGYSSSIVYAASKAAVIHLSKLVG